MSDMKCPFCGKPIRYLGTDLFTCNKCHIMLPAKHWLAYINTRKALDVATKYIKHTQKVSPFWFNRLANETLDKIKAALEQKDVK